jgi:hypothetical protein
MAQLKSLPGAFAHAPSAASYSFHWVRSVLAFT